MIVSNKAIQRIAQILYGQHTKMRSEPVPSYEPLKGDKVTISSEGRELQALRQRLAETPDVRTERVQQLRALIEKGEYKVSAEAIAERMLDKGDLK